MKPKLKAAWCLFVLLILSINALAQSPETQTENTGALIESQVVEESFETTLSELTARSFTAKAKAITKISAFDDKRVLPLMKIMVDGRLYYRKSDKAFVTREEVEEGYDITDFLTGESLGVVGSREIKKVSVNNKLRNQLNSIIAGLELNSDVESERENSARNMIKSPNEGFRPLLEKAFDDEESSSIKELLGIAIAMLNINSDEEDVRLSAVEVLGASVEPEAVAILNQLVEKDDNGKFIESSLAVAKLAESKLKVVKTKLGVYKSLSDLMYGLSLGSVLLLAAIGLAITFGVMGVINMAHGEMIMLGAYTTFAIQQLFPEMIHLSLFFAIPAAFLVSGSVGVLIERLVIRHLYGRPLDTLLATFGISLIIQQAVRTYRANNVPVINPEWMSGSWVLNGAFSLTYNRIYIIIFSLIVLALLILLLKKTMFGLQMRAVTQNRPMANSMGIRSNWVDALTFGLGSGIAGIAGVALSQITNVGPNLGQSYIIDSFMVVVFGGVGNLMGTFVAAMSLGVVNKFLEPVTGAVIAKIMVLIFIILFIQKRPRGLFALKGRFVED